MRVAVGDRVVIDGHPGEFMVMRVDLDRKSADVMTTSGIRRIQEGVSLSSLHPLSEAVPDPSSRQPSTAA